MDPEVNFIARHDHMVRTLGMKVEVATPEYAKVSMPLEEKHKNGMEAAHGGAIFALADVAFGAASNADRKYGVVNINSSIEYLLPGKVGPLVAEARALRLGGHIVSYLVQIFDGTGAMIAHATVTGYVTDQKLPDGR